VKRHTIHLGDVLDVLRGMESNSMSACLCDPPYGLGTKQPTTEEMVAYLTGSRLDTGGDFMGKQWDLPSVEVWREVYRVLKPGAYLLAFGGSRMFDLLAVGIRAAGFEYRDTCMYLYGSGFPKSLDVSKAIDGAAGAVREVVGEKRTPDGKLYSARTPNSTGKYNETCAHSSMSGETRHNPDITAPATESAKAWSGYGTALKPSFEGVVVARKPLEGTVAQNVAKWGVGGLAIDASRIGGTTWESDESLCDSCAGRAGKTQRPGAPATSASTATRRAAPTTSVRDASSLEGTSKTDTGCSAGPSQEGPSDAPSAALNSSTVEFGRQPTDLSQTDTSSTTSTRTRPTTESRTCNSCSAPITSLITSSASQSLGRWPANLILDEAAGAVLGDPARFFYCAKASRKEREKGCEALPLRSAGEVTDREDDSAGLSSPRAGAGRTGGARNHHPTVKPVDLIRYLARLILPPTPGAAILVPFSGSGSEVIGCLLAGWERVVGIERESDYVRIAEARIAEWSKDLPESVAVEPTKPEPVTPATSETRMKAAPVANDVDPRQLGMFDMVAGEKGPKR
jgi:DNA modification methylase